MTEKEQKEQFKKALKITRTEVLKCQKIIDDMFDEIMKELKIKNNTDLFDMIFDYVYNYPDNRQAGAQLKRCTDMYFNEYEA
tara:strand:- start:522 stop:767 length:246 start_codon:yes stop_codon:yes gene_type:complete